MHITSHTILTLNDDDFFVEKFKPYKNCQQLTEVISRKFILLTCNL